MTGFKILHKRLDRLSSEVTNYQTAIKSSLVSLVFYFSDRLAYALDFAIFFVVVEMQCQFLCYCLVETI